ncbi:hypothetical protein GTR04_4316 [Trichophyton interdigitale]|uniref:Uncharacterized protein n=1 Tax=Trichophyton interdigitale TaxID=101480 RepID=A0A9P4YGS6_9EURO|nr:hypothetical protein GY631_4160 [Trichophyton interdigitale]KAF3894175.1 hypothetical protein GY632_3891 [Trichophyton interdigitale]KAG8208282.1 hypothetical protein GTR04_4316 [Trichophyton interdigitale]
MESSTLQERPWGGGEITLRLSVRVYGLAHAEAAIAGRALLRRRGAARRFLHCWGLALAGNFLPAPSHNL